MGILIAFPVILLLSLLQITVISNLPLLNGTADVILLAVIAWSLQEKVPHAWFWAITGGMAMDFISAAPLFPYTITYLVVSISATLIKGRIWQAPLLVTLILTFLATIMQNCILFIFFRFSGTILPLTVTLVNVVFPSIVLNLIIALPIYLIFADLAEWLYPFEAK